MSEIHAVDPVRNDGSSGEGVCLCLDLGVPYGWPPCTLLLPLDHHGTFLSAGAILVLKVVVDIHCL